MGCDIHSHVEVRREGQWDATDDLAFDGRDYGLFGFLADVRNYSHSPVIAEPRGLPDDVDLEADEREFYVGDGHSASWLLLSELLAYDYEQVFWDRRITREVSPGHFDGAALALEGEGEHVTLRAFLGEWFFRRLDELALLGAPEDIRIVFWFDS